jgi:hypothetical protein
VQLDITYLLARSFDLLGTILIAFTAIRVHHRVLNEHTIDEAVFRSMKREQKLGVIGVLLIVTGFILEFAI